jgi:hypothetical protein
VVSSDLDALRTQVANQAHSVAETINEGFDGFHIGAGDYVVEATAPEGQSTGGGKLALQHIRLVPRRKGFTALIIGAVNPATLRAELRTYEHVALSHLARFGKAIDIDEEEYAELLEKGQVVMNLLRMKLTIVEAPPQIIAAAQAARKKTSPVALLVMVVVVLLAAMVVYRLLATRPG